MDTKSFSIFLFSAAFYILYNSKNEYVENVREYVFANVKNFYDGFWNETSASSGSENEDKIFSLKELGFFNNVESGLYLSILGKVYDVSSGSKFYGPGGTYNGFIGRDASAAFITGEFSEEGLIDDISNLSERQVFALYDWTFFYDENYIYKGKLNGRYYDKNGNPTEELKDVFKIVERMKTKKTKEEETKAQLPPCNIEWTADAGTRVWCTDKSGGIARNWVGVPRIYFEGPNVEQNRCVCVNPDSKTYKENQLKLGEYEGCDKSSTSCIAKVPDKQ